MKSKEFFNLCINEFKFLFEEYGFKKVKEIVDNWYYKLYLKNNTTGIIITFEKRDFYVFVQLCRLYNGEIQNDPVIIRAKTCINNFDYENLLLLRSPESIYPSHKSETVFDDSLIKIIIKHHAEKIKKYATDVLDGNFQIFKEIEKLVKGRISSHNEWNVE